jgi:hypothetical protein
MNVIVVFRVGGVVGIALHQHQFFVDGQDGVHGFLYLADGSRAGRDDDRLAFGSHALQRLNPVNLARTNFISQHVFIELVDGFEIVRGREIIDADLVAFFFQNGRPIEGYRSVLVNLEDGFLPFGLVRLLPAQ